MLCIVALLAAGTYALLSIPKENAPEVRIPVGIVRAVLPGASAEDVEQLVTNEIEAGVANLEGLDTLTSSSRERLSMVTVQFDASADLDTSLQKLRDAVSAAKANLPQEANDPVVSEINFAEQPVLILSITGEYAPAVLTQLGEDIKDELLNVKGVSRVEVSGVRQKEVQVVVQKEKLSQYGIRLTDVVSAIQASNAKLPVGSLTVDSVEYALNFAGDITVADEVRDIAITMQNGSILYVRDIADVVDGLERETNISRASDAGAPSEPSLTLSIFKGAGGNIVQTADAVKERLEELKSGILAGSSVVISLDLGKEVKTSLSDLTEVGFETMILVMLTLFITIGWRESLVAAVSIPLSFLIAFIGLAYSGNTLNFVSLFALILAIGILVDSGIVITEAIHTRMRLFATKEEAAEAALKEYAWPLIAGTMATVAVFAPLFFISGIVGQFIKSIPVTLIFALFASIFVTLGLVPLIAITFTKKESNRLEKMQEEYTHKFQEWYRAKLGYMLDNRRAQNIFLACISAAFFLALALPISGLLKTTFFPQEDIGYVLISIEKPQGTTLLDTDLVARQVEDALYGNPDIDSFATTVGGSSGLTGDQPTSGGNLANITILLKDKDNREHTSTEVVRTVREKIGSIPGATIRVSEPNNGPPSGAPVLVTFSGDNLDDLEKVTINAERVLSSIEGVSDIQSSVKDNGLEFTLTIDRGKAASLGLSPTMIATTLRTAVHGATATTIRNADDDTDVIVKLDLNPLYNDPAETTEVSADALHAISIQSVKGPILLGSVIDISLDRGKSAINHNDRKRIETVSSQVVGKTPIEITNEFENRTDELEMPQGVSMKIGGETEDVNQSFAEMGFAAIAGLVLMLAIMVMQFNSIRHALYLILMVVLSLIGVFGGLFISGQTLSFSSVVGIIALSGVIINHAIILTDSIHRLSRRPDLSPKEIVVQAAISRLRPIFLTTITTVIGMIPLAGATALWGPLAFAIMFGLAFSMILTLVMIPILTYRWPGNWFEQPMIKT